MENYNLDPWQRQQLFDELIRLAQSEQEYVIFKALNLKVVPDGNSFCVLHGDDLQTGIAAYGDTPHKAVLAFNAVWLGH